MSRYVALALVVLGVAAAPANGGGGVFPGADAGPQGVTAPGHAGRYVALAAGGGTLVARIDRAGGRVAARRWLRDRLIVPTAALDLAPTGLSADGGTLVLASPRVPHPRRWSVFAVLDARGLSLRRTIRLRGDFALDAVSSDGRTLFLVETPSSRELDRFAVRAYDVAGRRLEPEPILARARGWPTARATSRDGRWAYTLYQGRRVFLHALDTRRRLIEHAGLPQLAGELVGGLKLKVHHDGMLGVHRTDGGAPLVVVDPRGLAARVPEPPRRAAAGSGWLIIAAGLALLALVTISRAATRERAARRPRRPPARAGSGGRRRGNHAGSGGEQQARRRVADRQLRPVRAELKPRPPAHHAQREEDDLQPGVGVEPDVDEQDEEEHVAGDPDRERLDALRDRERDAREAGQEAEELDGYAPRVQVSQTQNTKGGLTPL